MLTRQWAVCSDMNVGPTPFHFRTRRRATVAAARWNARMISRGRPPAWRVEPRP